MGGTAPPLPPTIRMNSLRYRLLAVLAPYALVATLSCGGDSGAATTLAHQPVPTTPADPPVATTLSITLESVVFTAIGDNARFTAQVRDQNGNVMNEAVVRFSPPRIRL